VGAIRTTQHWFDYGGHNVKVQLSKDEVIELVKDHLPIPSGFRVVGHNWSTYNDYLDIEIEVIPPRLSMDRPLFPPQRPALYDESKGEEPPSA
jgi:hypothetical protein